MRNPLRETIVFSLTTDSQARPSTCDCPAFQTSNCPLAPEAASDSQSIGIRVVRRLDVYLGPFGQIFDLLM